MKHFVLLVLLFYMAPKAFSCSMLLEDYREWGEKVMEYEEIAMERARNDSDSILVVRALSSKSFTERKKEDTIIEDVIFNGPNPRSGKIKTVHKIQVLEVIKGNIEKGDVIEVNIVEPERFSMARCAGPSYEVVAKVDSFDDTFKYLVYLKGFQVLRINKFIEWPESITAEREYQLLKK